MYWHGDAVVISQRMVLVENANGRAWGASRLNRAERELDRSVGLV